MNDFDQDGDGEDSTDHGGTDCDDVDPTIFANAIEHDGFDHNCDGEGYQPYKLWTLLNRSITL